MRDFSADHRWLSINTATLRGAGALDTIIEACARHGVGAISPWRDQVAGIGLERTAALVRRHGLPDLDRGIFLLGTAESGCETAHRLQNVDGRVVPRRSQLPR